VRKAEGQTTSPVFEFINSDPRIPGITITGRFPVLVRASAKMFSRLGVRWADIHPEERTVRRKRMTRAASDRRAFLTVEEKIRNNFGARFSANFDELTNLSRQVVAIDGL
jgi:hypothetical protein